MWGGLLASQRSRKLVWAELSQSCKLPPWPLQTYIHPEVPLQRFYNLPKQHHPLGTKYSNSWDHGRSFVFKPKQTSVFPKMVLKKQVSARLLATTGKFRKWCWVFQSVQAGVAVQSKQHARAHGFQTAAPTVEQSIARRRVCWAENERGLVVSCLRKRYMSVGTLAALRFVAVL